MSTQSRTGKTKSGIKKASSLEKGWDLFMKGQHEEALAIFDSLAEEGGNPSALYGKACALFRASEHETALSVLSALIRAEPKKPAYFHTRSHIYGADEKYEKALKDLKKASELDPANGEVWCDMGGLYLIMKDYNQAWACFENAADIDRSCACPWFGKGMVALYQKKYTQANEYLNIALKQDAKHPAAHLARAETAFSLNHQKEGARDVKKVLSLDKDFADRFQAMLAENESEEPDDSFEDDNDSKTIDDLDTF